MRGLFRLLRRHPGFAISVILCVAIAVALTTTMVAILDAVKHPIIAFSNADRVVPIFSSGDGSDGHVRAADRIEMLRGATFIERLALTSWQYDLVEVGQYIEQLPIGSVSPDFFDLTGLRATSGRLFSGPDERTSALISESLRIRAFPDARTAIGSMLRVGDRQFEIIGVVPSTRGVSMRAEVWLVLPRDALESSAKTEWVTPVALMRNGAQPARVRAELDDVAARLTVKYGTGRFPFSFRVGSLKEDPLRFRDFHGVMAGAGLIVLLVACANVANLLLARALDRQSEHALRLALGAPPASLAMRAIGESLSLTLIGGAAGVLIAVWAMDIVAANTPPDLSWLGVLAPRLSWRVYAFALLASLAIATASALLPALRSARADPGGVLKSGAATMTRATRRHDTLVIVQLSLALLLVFCAIALLKAAHRVSHFDFGYDQTAIVGAQVGFRKDSIGYARGFDDLVARAQELPGARGAVFVGSTQVDRNTVSSENANRRVGFVFKRTVPVVGPRFFETLGIPLLAGRDFAAGDRATGAAIIDEKAAQLLWPGESPIGHVLKLGDNPSTRPWLRVIGLVHRFTLHMSNDPDLPSEAGVYVTQEPSDKFAEIIIRSDTPAITATLLRRMIRTNLSHSVAWSRVTSWQEMNAAVVSARYFMAGLFVVFAGFTLLLALAGLYGTLSYAVSRRLREFAVRGALGATDSDLRRLMWGQMMVAILAGTAIGGPAGMWAARSLSGWMYNVFYADVGVLLAAETVLVGTALLACLAPARRAGNVDVSRVLREL